MSSRSFLFVFSCSTKHYFLRTKQKSSATKITQFIQPYYIQTISLMKFKKSILLQTHSWSSSSFLSVRYIWTHFYVLKNNKLKQLNFPAFTNWVFKGKPPEHIYTMSHRQQKLPSCAIDWICLFSIPVEIYVLQNMCIYVCPNKVASAERYRVNTIQ